MSKVLIIQQFFGLGDIIFGQTIANDYINEGYKVLWPVKAEWVEGLRRAYPKVEFIDHELVPINYDRRSPHEENGFTYLPMRYSEYLMGRPYKLHMVSKYEYLKKDWKRWKEFAAPHRDQAKEMELMKLLGIAIGDKYNFISTVFGSAANHKIEINVGNQYKNIELKNIPGFSLFDWCGVIEWAATIHAVSSSTLYLFELLHLNAEEVHIYNRNGIEKNLDYVRFLFTKNYILHE